MWHTMNKDSVNSELTKKAGPTVQLAGQSVNFMLRFCNYLGDLEKVI